jgi:hypothetical protein
MRRALVIDEAAALIVSIVTFIIAASIIVVHSFGLLEPQMVWLKEYFPILALLLISTIAIILNVIYARLHRLKNDLDSVSLSARLSQLQTKLDTFQNSFDSVNLSTRLQQLQNILDAVNLPEIRQFNNPHDIYQYWTQRLQKARTSVVDLTWGYDPPHYTRADNAALKAYVNYIPEVCGRNVSYREVMTFPSLERVTRAKQMLDHNIHNYHLRYYDLGDHVGTPPLMQFSVIDSEEVFIFFYREPLSEGGRDELRLAIHHPTIVKLFLDYFDSIWRVAKTLKQGDDVRMDLLKNIQAAVEKFSTSQKPTPSLTSPGSDSDFKQPTGPTRRRSTRSPVK